MPMHSKSAQKKLAGHKKTHVVMFRDEVWLLLLKKNKLESKKKRFVVKKGLQLLAVITLPVINHFS